MNEVIKKKIPAHFNMTKYIRYFYAHWWVFLTGHLPFKEAPEGFLIAQDLGANKSRALKVSTCKTNMAARYDRKIVIWKGVFKQFNTIQFLCFVYRPSTSEKEVNRKENTMGKIAKGDRLENLRMLRYGSWRSSIPLRSVLWRRK